MNKNSLYEGSNYRRPKFDQIRGQGEPRLTHARLSGTS